MTTLEWLAPAVYRCPECFALYWVERHHKRPVQRIDIEKDAFAAVRLAYRLAHRAAEQQELVNRLYDQMDEMGKKGAESNE